MTVFCSSIETTLTPTLGTWSVWTVPLGHICHLASSSSSITVKVIENLIQLREIHIGLENGLEPALDGSIYLLKTGHFESDWMKKVLLEEVGYHDLSRKLYIAEEKFNLLAEGNLTWALRLLRTLLECQGTTMAYKHQRIGPYILKLFIKSVSSDQDPF